MTTILVRDMPATIYRRVKKMAQQENLSLSQEIVSLVLFALNEKEKKEIEEMQKQKEEGDVLERMRVLREEIHAKYGKQEDSWKLIRKMRDERAKRYE